MFSGDAEKCEILHKADQAYSHITDEPPDQHWDPQRIVC